VQDSIAFPERVRLRHIVFHNRDQVVLNKNLYGVEPLHGASAPRLALALNSTLTALFTEILARQPGGGGGPLDIDVCVAGEVPVPLPSELSKHKAALASIGLLDRQVESVFGEIGADAPADVALNKVKPDRRELDRIVMGEILGLTEDEQLEVYRAVVDLVRSRIERAKSAVKRGKGSEGIDIEALRDTIVERVKKEFEK